MRRIVAAVAVVVSTTAGGAVAQGGGAACVLDRAAMAAVERVPGTELHAYWDSVLRAETPRPGYAAGQPWFKPPVSIIFQRRQVTPYGLPRYIEGHELPRIGEHEGVGVYAAATEWWRVNVFYLPVREGCVFQPYQPGHWGPHCAAFGCPFPREEPPPGTVCRLRGDELVWARENEETGPSTQLATSRRWYVADRAIPFGKDRFGKIGLPRRLPPGSVRRIGEVDGVGVTSARKARRST